MDENSRKDQDNQQEPPKGAVSPVEKQGPSREELFAEIRQSLKEDESQKRKSGVAQRLKAWWDSLFRRKFKASSGEAEKVLESLPAPVIQESIADTELMQAVVPELETLTDTESPGDRLEEVQPLTDQTIGATTDEIYEVEQTIEEPPPTRLGSRDILSKPREGEQAVDNYKNIRDVALQEYEESPVAPVSEQPFSLRQSTRRALRDMPLSQKRILIGISILVVLFVMVAGGYFVSSALPKPSPTATPTTSNLPYPVSVSLPGGWSFPLNKGSVQDGKWNPAGPEWLDGTEVCRWVSLPYSVQLEAVLRTLKLDDPITLTMSNYDSLVYKTKSIQQMPVDQISLVDLKTPCLLIILGNEQSDKRWVVTSVP